MFQIRAIYSILSNSQRKQAIVLLIFILIGTLAETLGIGMVVPLMTLFMREDFQSAYPKISSLISHVGISSHQQLIIASLGFMIMVYILKSLYLGFLSWQQNRYNTRILTDLSRRLFATYLRQPYDFHLHRNSSELIRNIVNEVGYFLSTGLTAAMTLVTEGFILCGIIILLFVMEPIGALSLAITIGITALMFHLLTHRRIACWGATRQRHDGLRIKQVQHGLGGVKDVILLGREQIFLEQYDQHNHAQAKASLNLAILQSIPRLALEVIAIMGLAALIVTLTLQGRTMASIIPVLSLFGAAAFRLLPSLGKIISALQSARFGDSVLKLLQSELKLVTSKSRASSESLQFHRCIELKGVTFTYSKAPRPALRNLSLTIEHGTTVGLIGPSGSGKSSLVDLILGLLQADSGQILVDGQPIEDNKRGWQDQIGYVPQTIFLTDDTLRRNIAFGLSEVQIDETSIARSIKAAQLEEFVQSLPDGLETLVGERGVRLSGGQRQRIGIARAFYHNPEVLVLDEATSALDGSTESEVMDAIHALRGSKTVIIVAHRLSTVESCDHIFRLEEGRLVETGPPDEILRKLAANTSKAQIDFGLTA